MEARMRRIAPRAEEPPEAVPIIQELWDYRGQPRCAEYRPQWSQSVSSVLVSVVMAVPLRRCGQPGGKESGPRQVLSHLRDDAMGYRTRGMTGWSSRPCGMTSVPSAAEVFFSRGQPALETVAGAGRVGQRHPLHP